MNRKLQGCRVAKVKFVKQI